MTVIGNGVRADCPVPSRSSFSAGRIEVRASGRKGRGVFARTPFEIGELVERVPVIVVPKPQLEFLERTVLSYYAFSWGPDLEDGAIALGFCCLYNHSYQPDARVVKLIDEGAIEIVAVRAITAGDEVTLNYNGSPDEDTPLWFDGQRWGWYRGDGSADDSHGP
jgi:SET domain-containing protein